MDYITKNINSFTKRLAEAINGRQINALKSNPSSKKITWNWGGTFYPNAPKSGIRVRRSLALLLKVARDYTERQIGLNSTKLLKKMDIGGTTLNIKHQVQVINISIEPLVKL